MIYIITNNPDFKPNPIYRFADKAQLISYLDRKQEWSFDCETRGFDPYTKNLLSIQIGDFENQYVVDCESVDISDLKLILESKILVGQNIKFDLKFLYHKGIYPNKIYDTFVAEKVLNCGLNYIRASLDAIVERYLKIPMDKSVRVDIPKEGLTPRVISYAADDVKYLEHIKRHQLEKAEKQELTEVIKLENRFTPALAYIEYCGFKLNEESWKKKMEKDLSRMISLETRLNEWVMSNNLYDFVTQQLDIFLPQRCLINWSSPPQVAKFLTHLGIDCKIKDGDKTKLSVEAGVIQKYAEEHEIIRIYLEYKQAEKVVTTYGQNFLVQINQVTGRLHTNFKQILNTGRISSGGKDSDREINLINFQNIPKDPETRGCFVAEDGNTLIICDYSGQEQIVLANYSLDENILKFYDEGLGDMHSFVAAQMYPELKDLSLEEIKTKHKDKRQQAKAAGFAISYGGEGSTIAGNLNISAEDGNRIYNAYFEAFPGLRDYFHQAKQQGLRDGYIFISPLTKRKSYLPLYKKFKELDNKVNTKKFWGKYRELKALNDSENAEFKEMRSAVREYFSIKGNMERCALNYPIQGSSAEMVKISAIYIFDWILKNNLFGIVKFCNMVHDENVLESPPEFEKEASEVLQKSMLRAGKFFCKRILIKADPNSSICWEK